MIDHLRNLIDNQRQVVVERARELAADRRPAAAALSRLRCALVVLDALLEQRAAAQSQPTQLQLTP